MKVGASSASGASEGARMEFSSATGAYRDSWASFEDRKPPTAVLVWADRLYREFVGGSSEDSATPWQYSPTSSYLERSFSKSLSLADAFAVYDSNTRNVPRKPEWENALSGEGGEERGKGKKMPVGAPAASILQKLSMFNLRWRSEKTSSARGGLDSGSHSSEAPSALDFTHIVHLPRSEELRERVHSLIAQRRWGEVFASPLRLLRFLWAELKAKCPIRPLTQEDFDREVPNWRLMLPSWTKLPPVDFRYEPMCEFDMDDYRVQTAAYAHAGPRDAPTPAVPLLRSFAPARGSLSARRSSGFALGSGALSGRRLSYGNPLSSVDDAAIFPLVDDDPSSVVSFTKPDSAAPTTMLGSRFSASRNERQSDRT